MTPIATTRPEPAVEARRARATRCTEWRIYSLEYIRQRESCSKNHRQKANRRAILSLLVSSEQSVGDIERQLRMPQPTVLEHLRVPARGGFVESTVDAQRRLYRAQPEPLRELDALVGSVPVGSGRLT